MSVVIGIILMLLLFGGLGFAVFYQLRKTDPKMMDTSTIDTITTAQEFLPFEDIKDGMIVMGGHKYRAVIECSSTNYNLKTDKEKEIIEISFQRFINSLTFPITFFIQTKMMDNSKMLESLREDLMTSVKQYPQLEEYANNYFNEMTNLSSYIGNNKQKKKYVIIPYEEALSLGDLSDEEKYEYSSKELYNRASIIVDGLGSIGVKAHILNTKELAELIYSTYHKDNYSSVDDIVSGEFLSLITQSDKETIEKIGDDAKLDWILYEAQMRIKTELINENTPDFILKNCNKCIQLLDKLRDDTSGYFKEEPPLIFNEDEEETISLVKRGGLE